mmetsp:Transcript_46758/g.130181  ORF Transcript_46758/g.130181 Transcript_46758/m.130181 type:complete len:271 (-) Transcript_46758:287-1099(-)
MSFAKMTSAKSTSPTTSTSRSCMVRVASPFSMIFTNSDLEMFWLWSSSSTLSKILRSFDLAYAMAKSSLSAAATALTTSHSTPMSMFITVRVAMRRNKSNRSITGTLSCCKAVTRSLTSSSNAPLIHKVCMEPSTEKKKRSPTGLPLRIWQKMMAKTYSTPPSSTNVKKTDRAAEHRPFTRITSSGTARRSRAMRAMRVSRTSRNTRRTLVLPRPVLAVSDCVRYTERVITQVSSTISATRSKSKQNQGSLTLSRLRVKAMKRMSSSAEK